MFKLSGDEAILYLTTNKLLTAECFYGICFHISVKLLNKQTNTMRYYTDTHLRIAEDVRKREQCTGEW